MMSEMGFMWIIILRILFPSPANVMKCAIIFITETGVYTVKNKNHLFPESSAIKFE